MTLKNNRTSLLCSFKLYASFHSHWRIQTGVTVWKRLIWVKINDFFIRVISKFDEWHWKTIGHLFYTALSFVHHFKAMSAFNLELQSGNARFGSKSAIFLSRATLKFNGWHWKTIGQLSDAASNFVHHFIVIGEFKRELQSGNAQFGSKSTIFEPCHLEIWRMTLTNNRAPLLSNIKLCASLHRHMWIQTGVTVRKRLSGVMISVTLTFDLVLLHLSMVISPENFRMMRWQEHCQKRCDRRTDRQTDGRRK